MSPSSTTPKRRSGTTATKAKPASSRNGRSTARQAARPSAVKEKVAEVAPSADGGAGGSVVKPVVTAALAAAAGVVGGVVLDRTKLTRKKRVFGVPVPGTGRGLNGLAHQVGEAGKQFGKLASEVREAREKAERVGRALS